MIAHQTETPPEGGAPVSMSGTSERTRNAAPTPPVYVRYRSLPRVGAQGWHRDFLLYTLALACLIAALYLLVW